MTRRTSISIFSYQNVYLMLHAVKRRASSLSTSTISPLRVFLTLKDLYSHFFWKHDGQELNIEHGPLENKTTIYSLLSSYSFEE